MPKKGENIYKRKDGRWEGRYIKAYDPCGKAQYSSVYGKTYVEVKQKLFTARIEHVQGANKNTQHQKYRVLVHGWLSGTRMRVKESTHSRYSHLAHTHILPYLGDLMVDQLTTPVIEQHLVFLLAEGRLDGNGGLSPKTTSDVLTIIKGSIEYGRSCGFLVNCQLNRLYVKKVSRICVC